MYGLQNDPRDARRTVVDLFRKAKRIYSEEGIVTLVKKAGNFLYVKTPLYSPIYQERRLEATRNRWNIIERELSAEDVTLIDIGCNAGLFCEWAAQREMLAYGVDRFENDQTRDVALERAAKSDYVSMIQSVITPENVDDIPSFDVVLLLSVYHHWYSEFGEENAKQMLKSFSDSSKIFFEPPSESSQYVDIQAPYLEGLEPDDTAPDFEDNNERSIIDYHRNLLESVFGETHEISVIGSSTRFGTERYLFLVERLR